MAIFVLVHGAWHGGWCWYKLVAALEAREHTVLAPDLPGHGRDHASHRQPTYADYVHRVTETVRACPEPVVLVGHSSGGAVITGAAEAIPGQISRLVYLAAILCRNGQSINDIAERTERSLIADNLELSADRHSATLRPEGLRETLYADCPPEDVALARLLLTPEPLGPWSAPVRWTQDRHGAIPRAYIQCRQDQAIRPSAQRAMAARTPCHPMITLNSAHSPFFSMPAHLAEILEKLP